MNLTPCQRGYGTALVPRVTQPWFSNMFCSNTWKHKGRGRSKEMQRKVFLVFFLFIFLAITSETFYSVVTHLIIRHH